MFLLHLVQCSPRDLRIHIDWMGVRESFSAGD